MSEPARPDPRLKPVPPPDKRRLALGILEQLLEIPRVARIVQRGRDPEQARFTLEFADGRNVRVGTAKVFCSQAEMSRVLGVAIGCYPPPIDAKDWRKMISALINHAVEVDETPGESFADTVRDWLGGYAANASTDANGSMAMRKPFVEQVEDGTHDLHVHVTDLAVHIRRNYSAGGVKESELRLALADLGFERVTRHYTRAGKRSTTSYYRAPLNVLDAPGEA